MPPEFSMMRHLKTLLFVKTNLKLSCFCKKKAVRVLGRGAPPQTPNGFWKVGAELPTPETAPPPLQISDYASDNKRVLLILSSFRILLREFIERAK